MKKVVCFEEKMTETKVTTPKNCLGSITGEDSFCSSETKHDRRPAPRREDYRTKVTNPKLSRVRGSVNILGFVIFLRYSTIRELRDDIRQDNCNPTTRAATIGVATPTQNVIFCAHEPRNTTRHDAGKPTPSVATTIVQRRNISYIAYMSLGMPYDTTLTNRRQASRRLSSRNRHNIPYITFMSIGKPQGTTMANRRRPKIPQDTILSNRRQASRCESSRYRASRGTYA
jgi:hypothetical protein